MCGRQDGCVSLSTCLLAFVYSCIFIQTGRRLLLCVPVRGNRSILTFTCTTTGKVQCTWFCEVIRPYNGLTPGHFEIDWRLKIAWSRLYQSMTATYTLRRFKKYPWVCLCCVFMLSLCSVGLLLRLWFRPHSKLIREFKETWEKHNDRRQRRGAEGRKRQTTSLSPRPQHKMFLLFSICNSSSSDSTSFYFNSDLFFVAPLLADSAASVCELTMDHGYITRLCFPACEQQMQVMSQTSSQYNQTLILLHRKSVMTQLAWSSRAAFSSKTITFF